MMKQFITKVKSLDKHLRVELSPSSGFPVYTLYPRKKVLIEPIVKLANRYNIKIIPHSTGRNWGYASTFKSALDPEATVILNMSGMKKLKINEKHGFAVIEPGVTQEQIIKFLMNSKSKHTLDPIGVFSNTSYLGNLLENGIASHTLRSETLINAEFVTGKGDTLYTGMPKQSDSLLHNIYPNSLGPSFKSLLQQSNLGIVTQATIKLPKAVDKCYVIAECYSDKALLQLIQQIETLFNTDGFIGFNRVHDQKKFLQFLIAAHNNNPNDAEILKKICHAKWYAIMSVQNKKQTKLVKLINRINPSIKTSYGKTVITSKFLQSNLVKTSFIKEAPAIAISNFNSIQKFKNEKQVKQALDNLGLIFNSYVLPTDKKEISAVLKKIYSAERKFNTRILISLNPFSIQLSYLILTFVFNKNNLQEQLNCEKCSDHLSKFLSTKNVANYRVADRSFHKIFRTSAQQAYLKSVKKVFDPKNIINPGHYNV